MTFKPLIFSTLIAFYSCGTEVQKSDLEVDLVIKDSTSMNYDDSFTEILVDSAELPRRMREQPEMILGQANGDLDKDGIAEKVVVFSRDLDWESGAPRDVIIYKQDEGGWEEWVVTENAIYHADEGGIMGDPFGDVQINNGILEISQQGGSSWKWAHTDKFRYQDGGFYLIGYSSISGKPCEYWKEYDYNLSTGDCNFSFETDVCEDYTPDENYGSSREEKFNHKMDKLPQLNNRRTFEYSFKSPKGEEIYL